MGGDEEAVLVSTSDVVAVVLLDSGAVVGLDEVAAVVVVEDVGKLVKVLEPAMVEVGIELRRQALIESACCASRAVSPALTSLQLSSAQLARMAA